MRDITRASSVFYGVLSIIVFILAYAAENTDDSRYVKTIVALLSFVAGFRGDKVGADTLSYIGLFRNINRGIYSFPEAGLIEGKDVGFTIVSRILLTICKEYWFPLLVYAIIIYGLTAYRLWEMRKDSSFFVSFSSYYILFFFLTLNELRQHIAVAIVFFATRYIKRNRMQRSEYIKFFGLILIASTFHSSALLGLIYFIVQYLFLSYSDSGEKWYLAIFSVVGAAGSTALLSWVIAKMDGYSHYFIAVNAEGGMRLYALVGIWIFSFFLYNPKDPVTGEISDWNRYFLNTTRLYFLISCALGTVGYYYYNMTRMAYYYWPYQGVYFGIITREWSEAQRVLLKIMIYAVLGYILMQYLFWVNGSNHHPFYFCWQ